MMQMRVAAIVMLSLSLGACAAKAQVRTEAELPLLDPPSPPPRVVVQYEPEPEPIAAVPPVENAVPAKPAARPSRPEQRPEPVPATPDPVETVARPPAPSLTLSPTPGTEAQTVVAIRDLLGRATRDLSRVNPASLNTDGKAQYESARRFIQQAEDALKTRNVVFAGKLADKAATMAAVLVR
jgi:hypothetical protein